jgi:hypothetical protein
MNGDSAGRSRFVSALARTARDASSAVSAARLRSLLGALVARRFPSSVDSSLRSTNKRRGWREEITVICSFVAELLDFSGMSKQTSGGVICRALVLREFSIPSYWPRSRIVPAGIGVGEVGGPGDFLTGWDNPGVIFQSGGIITVRCLCKRFHELGFHL